MAIGLFATLFVGSALLFRHASHEQPERGTRQPTAQRQRFGMVSGHHAPSNNDVLLTG